MTEKSDLTQCEMPSHDIQIVDVMLNSHRELRLICEALRAAAIAHVVQNQGTTSGKRPEIVDEWDTVGNDNLGAVTHRLKEQADPVIRRQVAFAYRHFRTLLRSNVSTLVGDAKNTNSRGMRGWSKAKTATTQVFAETGSLLEWKVGCYERRRGRVKSTGTTLLPIQCAQSVSGGVMRSFAALIAVVVVFGLAASNPARSQSTSAQGTWTEKAKLGEQRTEAGVVALNGKVYVLGGMARGQDSHPLNQEYDPAADRWRERAPMPGPLSHPGAAAMNGKIYVVGGFLRNVHLDAQNAAYEYDAAMDRWRMLPPLKSPRGSVGVV